jgi:hypothetical protein
MLQGIREINHGFPLAAVVAVDLPSGMPSDSGEPAGEFARADYTVTFTAPKVAHAMPPNCDHIGELIVGAIGSPPELYAGAWLELVEPAMFANCWRRASRRAQGHLRSRAGGGGVARQDRRGGHGRLGGLRAGAGLVTVASAASAIAEIAAHAPELMTEPLPETESGSIALNAEPGSAGARQERVAMGPGLGRAPQIAAMVMGWPRPFEGPMVLDADALVGRGHARAGGSRAPAHPHPAPRRNGASDRARPPPKSRRIASARRALMPRSTASPWSSKASAR